MLAEIKAVGLTGKQMDELRTSMDLDSNRIHELLDRAEESFEAIKEQTEYVRDHCMACTHSFKEDGDDTELLKLARSVIRDMARGWLDNDLVVSPRELVERIGAARVLAAWSVPLPKQLGDDYAKHRNASSAFRYDFEDIIQACVREALCNARDAHREAGEPDRSVKVILPTEMSRQISICDQGPGISPRRMGDIFLNYVAALRTKAPGASTKGRVEGDLR